MGMINLPGGQSIRVSIDIDYNEIFDKMCNK
jgi:hypothetical protein